MVAVVSGSDAVDRAFQFHLEEFKQLRAEILQRQRIQFSVEIGAAAAVFVLTTYLIANESSLQAHGAQWAWWLPFGVVLAAFILSRGFVGWSYQISSYIREKVEKAYALDGTGWETKLAPPDQKRSSISISKVVFWLALAIPSIAIAVTMARPSMSWLSR